MATEYNSFRSAEQEAKERSIKNPGIGFHVNWIEGTYWEVSMFAEFLDQEFWMNGQLITPDSN